jgi:predicted secreted protein
MAILTGNNGKVWIDNAAGTLKEVLAVRNFSIELTSDTIETTTMGVDVRTYLKGLSTWSGNADVYFDDTHFTTGNSNLIQALNPTTGGAVGQGTVSVELYLLDTSNKFAGDIIVTGFTINSSMDGMVEASISFQGSGSCSFTA